MAFILPVPFPEANKAEIIKRLCEDAELPESVENATRALRQLGIERVRYRKLRAAEKIAEGEPPIE
jgi:hypothetical protein